MGTLALLAPLLASQLWFHIVVDSPDEQVEVNVPVEWVSVAFLDEEAGLEMTEEEWSELITELEDELAVGDSQHIVRVREDDETVDVYFEKRAEKTKGKRRATRLVVHVKEADGSRVFIRMPLWIARPILRAAIHSEGVDEDEMRFLQGFLKNTKRVEPFDMVMVESEDERVRISFK